MNDLYFSITQSEMQWYLDNKRKCTGNSLLNVSYQHYRLYPHANRQQTFVDGFWIGVKFAMEAIQRAGK